MQTVMSFFTIEPANAIAKAVLYKTIAAKLLRHNTVIDVDRLSEDHTRTLEEEWDPTRQAGIDKGATACPEGPRRNGIKGVLNVQVHPQ